MLRTLKTLLLAAALVASTTLTAQAFNAGAVGPVSLQNGFPVWWQDNAGVRIDLCLTAACLADPVIAGNRLSVQTGFGAEAFWWMFVGDNDSVNLELAMEAAWATPAGPIPGDQFPFARVRINGVVDALGEWTINGPGFVNFTVEATVDGKGGIEFKNKGTDIEGFVTDVPPYSRVVTPGLTPVSLFYGVGGNVLAQNITITGPPGSTTQTITPAQFALQTGRLFNSGNNTAPFANHDVAGTLIGTPVTINLTANDVDIVNLTTNVHGINPQAVGLGATLPFVFFVFEPGDPENAAAPSLALPDVGRVIKNPDGTVTLLPLATFSGVASFPYVIQDTGGCISGQATEVDPITTNNICFPPTAATTFAPAQVIVTVEQLQATQAVFRPKVNKWDVSGTSSVVNLTTTDAANNPIIFTNLTGAQEVPPRPSAGSGEATVTIRTDAATSQQVIDYTLTYTGLTGVTQAHIHGGAGVGTNVGFSVFFCTTPQGGAAPAGDGQQTCPTSAGTVTGTLTQADFLANGAVQTFADLIAAIQAGNTYVNVHTVAFGGGELRGQLGRNVVAAFVGPTTGTAVGTVAVQPPAAGQATATWTLPEKLTAIPTTAKTLTVQSSAGNTVTVPIKFK